MSVSELGKILMVAGLIIVVIGLLLLVTGKTPLGWLGRLPGDFYYRGKNFTFYFPLATGLLISLILSFIFWLITRK